MNGKFQIELGAKQLTSGMSSSDFATDGALGVSSQGLNPFVVPGAMYSIANPTNISTNVVGNILATCEDSNAVSPNNRYMIDDAAGAANYYSYNGATITKVKTGTATGTTYVAGKSDFISFNGFFYGSSPTVLNKWDGTSGAGLTEAYQTFGDSNADHPMLIYQGFLWVGDGNTLSTLSSGGSYTTSVLTLTAKEKIVALGIDPATGLMMISVQTVYDISDTIPSLKAVYLYDGISAKPTRKILVDDLVTAFVSFQGQVICGIGTNIGVWNGNGVTFLRMLKNASVNNGNTDLPYKHHFCVFGRTLNVIDGYNVLSYGPVVANSMGFFYTAYSYQLGNINTYHLSCIFPGGKLIGDRLAVCYYNLGTTTCTVFIFDFGDKSAGQGLLYFNNIYFPRPVTIRSVRIITTGITTVSGIGGFRFFDQDGNIPPINSAPFGEFYVPSQLAPASSSPQYMFEFDYQNYKLQAIQPALFFGGQGFGVVRFIIYYDIAE